MSGKKRAVRNPNSYTTLDLLVFDLEILPKLIQYWNNPLFQSKSEIQKRNRNSGVDGRPSTHMGGSLSHKKHAIHLAEKLKRKPTAGDVFKYTHSKNHDSKTFIDPKSKQVYDNLEAQLKELSQNVNDSEVAQPIDENKLYFDVVGKRTRRTWYMVSDLHSPSFMAQTKVMIPMHLVLALKVIIMKIMRSCRLSYKK
ncbi:hypothetical protein POM88_006232 [Heracleum sosnowskyi]|uniref:Uncharacterized protein n=1 Tax=Heracleum sosnowskyi TaxID=360622 RepID=A0AAD8J2C6_9APIA|nr:hypothetical protein POM88_006232 [Heracleum sosnowskyi]